MTVQTATGGIDSWRRVRVWQGAPCEDRRNLLWSYRAEPRLADGLRDFLGRLYPSLAVVIDEDVSDDLEPLPDPMTWMLAR